MHGVAVSMGIAHELLFQALEHLQGLLVISFIIIVVAVVVQEIILHLC